MRVVMPGFDPGIYVSAPALVLLIFGWSPGDDEGPEVIVLTTVIAYVLLHIGCRDWSQQHERRF